ncbi:MAG TPA: beta-galactosidase GalA [Terriglobia bacterium]|nr:beta-galactosidase GalA [Terriglobia bacterium]
MTNWTRRDFLKTSVAASAAAGSLRVGAGSAAFGKGKSVNSPDQGVTSGSSRERLLLDFGWQFYMGDADKPPLDFNYGRYREYGETGDFFLQESRGYPGRPGPSSPAFDGTGWRQIDLPHDWAVELPFQEDRWLTEHGSKPLGRTYPATSIGWYRRVFDIPSSDAGKRLSIEFDGVFRDSMVALNGNFLGRNLSGYAPFRYDITDHANYGGQNILVVRVDATEYEGWFYEGAGIYRHVWLVKTNPLHVPQWGTFVTSEVQSETATVTITTEASNDGDSDAACQIVSTILDANGNQVAASRSSTLTIPAWRHREQKQKIAVSNPALWSIEDPHLYRLVTTLEADGAAVDRYETPFGIRTIRFDPAKGFFLNGKSVKIKGTCNHQDHAGVGSALPDRLQDYRIAKLKEMGSNGYRTSHNPPTPELLDACDRLGMVVLDETRMFSSATEGLSQLNRLVRRDRNHPSVVFWSTGNEEPEQSTERGARMCATMKRLVQRLDPTRPITQAMNNGWGKGISAVLDVQGFNYHHAPQIDAFHQKFPNQPTTGTEVGSTVSTRGIYANDKEKGYVSAYDVNNPPWATTAEEWWQTYDERAYLSGGFVWTGFDYRGEPTPYGWPCINSHFGIMDTCGFPKDNYYYYQAWWSGKPVLHLFPHWNWSGKEGQEIEVWCHSNLETIELYLNGQSLGSRKMDRDSHVAWKVKYAPGTLEARGYRGGQHVLTDSRQTTGDSAQIVLQPDRQKIAADGEDVSVIEFHVVDAQGRLVPVADNEISFRVSGNGKIIGVGNGDPSSHEPDKASQRRAFNGLCVAIVQSTREAGEIHVQATSPGLEPGAVVIQCEQTTPRPAVA